MRTLALALAAFLLPQISGAAVNLGHQAPGTPYDRYMGNVRTVLRKLDNRKSDMEQVKVLMKKGRSFRYHLDDPYVPAMPSVTASQGVGDCKDKALWLCDQINDASVRFVIGKTNPRSKMSHAWVMWNHEGRWWILDCTLKSAPIAADTLPADRYVPLYSYGKNRQFTHTTTMPLNMEGVAARKGTMIALKSRR